MKKTNERDLRPDYGLDAPHVVRNLLLIGSAGLLLWITAALNIWSGRMVIGPIDDVDLIFPVNIIGVWFGLGFTAMGLWMIWSSRIGKIMNREKLLDYIEWTGAEIVLDIGCGRGLMLIGAAKRLTSGKAWGIDLWNNVDLSGNRPESTLKNAEIEKVADRIEIKTADMRSLPFSDDSFDLILSCSAIHNIPSKEERAKAISEIVRVMKPEGLALIEDIRNESEYKSDFNRSGCYEIKSLGSAVFALILSVITFGNLKPVTLLVRKPTSAE
jgi:arsenite methyltransferase